MKPIAKLYRIVEGLYCYSAENKQEIDQKEKEFKQENPDALTMDREVDKVDGRFVVDLYYKGRIPMDKEITIPEKHKE